VQVETCTGMALLQSNHMAPIKLHNKIIPETS